MQVIETMGDFCLGCFKKLLISVIWSYLGFREVTLLSQTLHGMWAEQNALQNPFWKGIVVYVICTVGIIPLWTMNMNTKSIEKFCIAKDGSTSKNERQTTRQTDIIPYRGASHKNLHTLGIFARSQGEEKGVASIKNTFLFPNPWQLLSYWAVLCHGTLFQNAIMKEKDK